MLSAGLVDEAIEVSRNAVPTPDTVNQLEQHSALGAVLAAGWRAINTNPRCTAADMRAAIEAAGRTAAHRLERYLPALGTIASGAPLLGLLGTVFGMIEIFSGFMDGGMANTAALASGIGKALITTAAGLIVAIPAVFFHRYLLRRIDEIVVSMEQEAIKLVEVVQGDREVDFSEVGKA